MRFSCYITLSDCVAETCEACDRGGSCGDPLSLSIIVRIGVDLRMPKPFLTYRQQIDKLKGEKGLQISDEQYAEDMLRRNSYFALITGYKHLF